MFTDFYTTFYYAALMLCALVSMVLFSRLKKPFSILALLIIVTLISELTARWFAVRYSNNYPVYHVFTPLEYCFYAVIYSSFFKSRFWNWFLFSSSLFIILFEIINAVFLQPIYVDNTNIMITESLLLMFLSLMLFVQMRTMFITENILTEGMFWFNSAVLIYYAFDILFWGFHSLKVYEQKNPPLIIYYLMFIMSGLLYIVYTFSILLNLKKKHAVAEHK